MRCVNRNYFHSKVILLVRALALPSAGCSDVLVASHADGASVFRGWCGWYHTYIHTQTDAHRSMRIKLCSCILSITRYYARDILSKTRRVRTRYKHRYTHYTWRLNSVECFIFFFLSSHSNRKWIAKLWCALLWISLMNQWKLSLNGHIRIALLWFLPISLFMWFELHHSRQYRRYKSVLSAALCKYKTESRRTMDPNRFFYGHYTSINPFNRILWWRQRASAHVDVCIPIVRLWQLVAAFNDLRMPMKTSENIIWRKICNFRCCCCCSLGVSRLVIICDVIFRLFVWHLADTQTRRITFYCFVDRCARRIW